MWCELCVHSLFQLFAAIWLTLALSWWLKFNSFRIIQAEEKLLWFVRDLLTSRIRIWPMKRFATNAFMQMHTVYINESGQHWVSLHFLAPNEFDRHWVCLRFWRRDEMNRDEMHRDEMAAMKCPRITIYMGQWPIYIRPVRICLGWSE